MAGGKETEAVKHSIISEHPRFGYNLSALLIDTKRKVRDAETSSGMVHCSGGARVS